VISGRRSFSGHGSSSISAILASRIQVSTSHGGGSLDNFTMERKYPTIRLPEFRGDGSDDREKNMFICEKIWVEKNIIYEDTKVV
jgi:hypothetical protein